MKQESLFNIEEEQKESQYTERIKSPVYKPRGVKPHAFELVDRTKYAKLKSEIDSADISEEDKRFLYMAATRHLVFNYELIADYYANTSKDIQSLMEDSALVIIDFNKAIEKGYVKLNEETAKLYGKDYD